jgi:hypothetical protein
MLAGRQAGGGCHNGLDGLLYLLAGTFIGYTEESTGPADPLKGTPKFRCKNDRDGHHHGRQHSPDKPGERRKINQAGQKGDQDQDYDYAAQQNHGLRIANEIEHAKENQRNQQDINDTQPIKTLKDEKEVV